MRLSDLIRTGKHGDLMPSAHQWELKELCAAFAQLPVYLCLSCKLVPALLQSFTAGVLSSLTFLTLRREMKRSSPSLILCCQKLHSLVHVWGTHRKRE